MSARDTRFALSIALTLAFASGCSAPRPVRLPEWDATRATAVRRELEQYAEAHGTSVRVAVMRGDSLVLVGAVGAASGAVAHDRLPLGELQRQVLAAAAWLQSDAGHIAMDEPLPLPVANDRVQAPTLRELLHQCSGLAARDSAGAWVAEHRPRERWTERPAHAQAAVAALEAATGRSAATLMSEAWARADLGVPVGPDADLRANVAELARWARALEQGEIVSRERYAEMTRLFALRDEREWPYGMGLALQTFEGRAKVMHAASSDSVTLVLARYPQDDVSIALAVRATDAWQLTALERRIARRIFGAPEPALADEPIKPIDRDRAVGDYACGDLQFGIASHEDRLRLTVLISDGAVPRELATLPLRHVGGGRYVSAEDPDAVHVWVKRGNGPAPEIVIGWFGLPCQALRR